MIRFARTSVGRSHHARVFTTSACKIPNAVQPARYSRQSLYRPQFQPLVNRSHRLPDIPRPFAKSSRFYSSKSNGPQVPSFKYIALIAILGSVGFAIAVRLLDKKLPHNMTEEEYQQETKARRIRHKHTAFTKDQAFVVFVLGGPGSGKGTQCSNLVRDYGFVHLSAGDLLRAEQNRPGSRYGELIDRYIKDGQIVPMEITLALLQRAMTKSIEEGKTTKFLIDGFPRKMDQAIKFEEDIAISQLVLFFECPEQVMLQRLLKRGQNSGRADDNIDSIKKRLQTFIDTSMPVVEYFDKVGKVVKVRCDQAPAKVYTDVKEAIADKGVEIEELASIQTEQAQ